MRCSIVVNRHGARFHDAGEDVWPEHYNTIDAKSIDLFMPSVYPPEAVNTIDRLSQKLQPMKNHLEAMTVAAR
mgnify:CR=1 FL=1